MNISKSWPLIRRLGTVFSLVCLMATAALWTPVATRAEDKPSPTPSKKPPVAQPRLPRGVRMERDIPYVTHGDDAQRLDLYLPETPPEQPLPLIVHIHGGGWMGGSKFPCSVANMVKLGYVVASIEYRFSQKALFPAQIQDCQAAIRWLRANSKQYHIDPDHIGVVGGSAGGHLSALVGTAGGKKAFPAIGGNEDQSDRVQCVCDIFGPTNFATVIQQAEADKNVRNIFKFNKPGDPYSSLIGTSLDADKQKTDAVSPIHYVSKETPPILILHGTHDALVPYAQSEEFVAALKSQGIEVWLQTLPGSGHGGPAFGKPPVIMLMQKFFDKYLKGADVKIDLVPEEDVAIEPPKPAAK